MFVQFLLVMKYLSEMTEEQTLVLYSGHPLGLFPSHRLSPRLVISNGMVSASHSSGVGFLVSRALYSISVMFNAFWCSTVICLAHVSVCQQQRDVDMGLCCCRFRQHCVVMPASLMRIAREIIKGIEEVEQ